MRKGLDYDYDEQNIYVVICDSNIPQRLTIQNITHKTTDRATQNPLKTGDELRYYGIITISGLLVAPVML